MRGIAYVASPANKFYIRKSGLEKLTDAGLRQEVMAGGVNKYLMNGSSPALVACLQLT